MIIEKNDVLHFLICVTEDSFTYHIEPGISKVTDMTEFLHLVETLPDQEIHSPYGRNIRLNVNACDLENKTSEQIPRYQKMRLESRSRFKMTKVTSSALNTQSRGEPTSTEFKMSRKSSKLFDYRFNNEQMPGISI